MNDMTVKATVGTTTGNGFLDAKNAVATDTMSLEDVINENNRRAIGDLVSSIEQNGPGVYEIFYQFPDNKLNHGDAYCYSVLVGKDAIVDGKFNPAALNFHNPGSSPVKDISYIDQAYVNSFPSSPVASSLASGPSELTRTNANVEIHTTLGGNNAYFNRDGATSPYEQSNYSAVSSDLMSNLVNTCSSHSDFNKNNVSFSGFSALDFPAFKSAIKYSHDTGARDFYIFSMEPAQDEYSKRINLDGEIDGVPMKDIIKKNNITIIDFHNVDYMHINNHIYGEQENDDLHYFEVVMNAYSDAEHERPVQGGHGWINQIVSSSDFGQITSGNFDWNLLQEKYGEYIVEDVDDSGNPTSRHLYFEFLIYEHIPNEDGTVTIKPIPLDKMNEVLAENIVKSKLEYTVMYANIIHGKINDAALLDKKNIELPRKSTTEYPYSNINCYNELLASINNLRDKLDGELQSLCNASMQYAELDDKLAAEANEL